ncbi:MAG: type II toxin-antitoxin system RelE/ParE family toxin [Negativicoccus succinicivorans]|nr:type II toxin-antitoxin system RelE/ParE family toxin [Negativicoccus succinicivorans]
MKSYKVVVTKSFSHEFKKLDRYTQQIILKFIKDNLENTDNPYKKGKRLKGELSGFWRYRIMDYRLLVEIYDDQCVIKALRIGHRKQIYQRMR